MTLNDLSNGEKFKIVKVFLCGEVGRRLVDMGLNRGVEGEMVRCALLGDPIEIIIRGYHLSLRKNEARGVEVELLSTRDKTIHRKRWLHRLFGLNSSKKGGN